MPLVSVASDTFLEATPPVDLDLHVPTSFPAITGWDYGDPTGEWTIENPPPFRAQRQSGAGAYVRSRNDITTVDFNGPFTVISDIVRGAVDDTLSDGLVGFFLKSTGTANPFSGEGLWVGFERTGGATSDLICRRVNAAGVVVETKVFASVGIPTAFRYTINVAADGVTIELITGTTFTGASPTNHGTIVMSTDIRSPTNLRIGLRGGTVGSGVTDIYLYDLQQDPLLLNPWSECDPCPGPTVWVDSACPAIPAVAFSAGFSGGFE